MNSDKNALDANYSGIIKLFQSGQHKVLSLDIFDTVLFRDVDRPTDLFETVADLARSKGLIAAHVSDAAFREIRIECESLERDRMYKRTGQTEILLDAVYQAMPSWVFLSSPSDVMDIEISCEYESLRPDIDIAALTNEVKQLGGRVIAVSDTYFSRSQLLHLLERSPIVFDTVYISNEFGVSKDQGLFRHVLDRESLSSSDVVHVGDNPHADVEAPSLLGISTVHIPRFDNLFAEIHNKESSVANLFADNQYFSANAYLGPLRRRAWRRAVWDAGAQRFMSDPLGLRLGVHWFGPAIAGFCEHLIENTDENTALLFITREGFKLKYWFDMACEAQGLSRQTTELSVSRATLFAGGFEQVDAESLKDFIRSRRTKLTVERFCEVFKIDSDLPRSWGFDVKTQLVEEPVIDAFLANVLSSAESVQSIKAVVESGREKIVRHTHLRLSQAGMSIDGTRDVVVVDLGWAGQTFELLVGNLRDSFKWASIRAEFFAVDSRVTRRRAKGFDIRGWLFNGDHQDRLADIALSMKEITEQTAMPNLGSVTDYQDDGDAVRSSPPSRSDREALLFEGIHKGADIFLQYYSENQRASQFKTGLGRSQSAIRVVYARPFILPDVEELEAFRAISHDENNMSVNFETLGRSTTVPTLGFAHNRQFFEGDLYWAVGEVMSRRPAAVLPFILNAAARNRSHVRFDELVYYGQGHLYAHASIKSKNNAFSTDLYTAYEADRNALVSMTVHNAGVSDVELAFGSNVKLMYLGISGPGPTAGLAEKSAFGPVKANAVLTAAGQRGLIRCEVADFDYRTIKLKLSASGEDVRLNICLQVE